MAKKTTQNPEHKWIVGTWYMNPMGYMINYQRGNHAYGFQGGWKNDLRITPKYLEDNEFIEAPSEDILDYLSNRGVKRILIIDSGCSHYEAELNPHVRREEVPELISHFGYGGANLTKKKALRRMSKKYRKQRKSKSRARKSRIGKKSRKYKK